MKALFLAGPTATGKTSLALEIAARCDGEIIGADAFQIYRGLDVLAAKPSLEERKKVPHHMIGTIPITDSFDVAQYLEAAEKCAEEIRSRGKLPIFAGGTGLYIRALTHGLSDLPKADATIRTELAAATLEDLQARYTALDPEGAKQIDLKNKRRLVRAIEVCMLTGKPFSSFRNEWDAAPKSLAGFFLVRDRDDLYARINQRVDWMFRHGAVKEVRTLPETATTATQAIGVKEIRAMLSGEMAEWECIERVKQATRRYAKRQITWFQRETWLETIDLSTQPDPETAIELIARSVR